MVTTEGKTMRAISTEVTNEERVQPHAARSTWGVAWRSGLAGLILQLSIVAALLLQGLIQAGLPGHMARRLEDFGVYIGLGAVLLCCTLGGALWARLLARSAGVDGQRRMAWASGATYAVTTVVAIVLLNASEAYFLSGPGRRLLPVHMVFMIVFTLAAGGVAGITGLVMGLALRDRSLAWRLAIYGGLAAGAAFLAAALVQDLLGRRVGGVNAAATFTMITVILLGNVVASVAASGVMGVALWRWMANLPGLTYLYRR
jgi:hypothetical protein